MYCIVLHVLSSFIKFRWPLKGRWLRGTWLSIIDTVKIIELTYFFLLQKQLRSLLIIGATLLLMLLLRLKITIGNTPEFSTADNPTARSASMMTRFLTFSYLPMFNFKLLLCPDTLSFDWGMDAIPRITSIFDSRNVISVLFYSVLYQAGRRGIQELCKKRRRFRGIRKSCSCQICYHNLQDNHSVSCRVINNNNISSHTACACTVTTFKDPNPNATRRNLHSTYITLLISLAFLTLPFIPATNLFVYVGFVVAERVLYIPSVGYCLLLGLAVSKLRRTKCFKVSCFSVLVLLLVFSVKTLKRNRDWISEESLYRSAISVNPPKGKYYSFFLRKIFRSVKNFCYSKVAQFFAFYRVIPIFLIG